MGGPSKADLKPVVEFAWTMTSACAIQGRGLDPVMTRSLGYNPSPNSPMRLYSAGCGRTTVNSPNEDAHQRMSGIICSFSWYAQIRSGFLFPRLLLGVRVNATAPYEYVQRLLWSAPNAVCESKICIEEDVAFGHRTCIWLCAVDPHAESLPALPVSPDNVRASRRLALLCRPEINRLRRRRLDPHSIRTICRRRLMFPGPCSRRCDHVPWPFPLAQLG